LVLTHPHCFSQLAVILQSSIDLSGQATKESIFGHWHPMQGLGNTFKLAVALQTTPVERFSVGPINRIPDRHSKLVFNLHQLFGTLCFRRIV
jgi:hypothetical protein